MIDIIIIKYYLMSGNWQYLVHDKYMVTTDHL